MPNEQCFCMWKVSQLADPVATGMNALTPQGQCVNTHEYMQLSSFGIGNCGAVQGCVAESIAGMDAGSSFVNEEGV
jgi:hypothetical protein